ncbi:hypothetical protein [Candidatus Neptunichlamydia sp. REUL1]|uniref:hypothetical protein n=1 Tax=Candidatus Neptunichlamydia sp. REUL1 TaxID=3064277 RepID=UPI00292FE525|nr:hypothetical protein [Candidatus Neptunochlamydia sp. REUL1]
MRVEGAPSARALEHYDAAGKQEEIDKLSKHLDGLRGLATQGTVSEELREARSALKEAQEEGRSALEEIRSALKEAQVGEAQGEARSALKETRSALKEAQVGEAQGEARSALKEIRSALKEIRSALSALKEAQEKTRELELQDGYAKSLGLIATKDIDTEPLGRRFNLQAKDYYSMLSKALGLVEGGTTGSATLTRELLAHLNQEGAEALADDSEVRATNEVAAYLLITEGKISWGEYFEFCSSSEAVKKANEKAIKFLEGITDDTHSGDTISMRVRGLKESITLARFTDQIHDFKKHIQREAQPALTKHMDKVQTPVYMIENDNVGGLIAAFDDEKNPSTLAEEIVEAIGITAEHKREARNYILKKLCVLKNSRGEDIKQEFAEIKEFVKDELVKSTRTPSDSLDISSFVQGAVLEEEGAVSD